MDRRRKTVPRHAKDVAKEQEAAGVIGSIVDSKPKCENDDRLMPKGGPLRLSVAQTGVIRPPGTAERLPMDPRLEGAMTKLTSAFSEWYNNDIEGENESCHVPRFNNDAPRNFTDVSPEWTKSIDTVYRTPKQAPLTNRPRIVVKRPASASWLTPLAICGTLIVTVIVGSKFAIRR
jgi:hypothetical protein